METNHLHTTLELLARLNRAGWWISRSGAGHHVQLKHNERPGKITVDIRAPFIPSGSLVSVYLQAGLEP